MSAARSLRTVVILLLGCAIVLPFVPLFIWSFSDRWFFPDLLPARFGLRAWRYVFDTAGAQIIGALWQSVAVSAATALIAVAVGVPAGRVLGLHDFRGKNLVAVLLLLPVIVPSLSVAMGLHLWFLRLGLTETAAGVVLIHLTFCLPYAVFVMWGVFANYNPDFEDQARSLGASGFQVVWGVMLPFIWTGVAVAALFSFLLSWSQYLSTLIIGGGTITTLPILLFALMGSGDRPVAAAVSLVFVAPAVGALILTTKSMGQRSLSGVW
ncbi:MAG: ABC transporter permease subunit [Desulfosarcinaceae bacterium]